MQPARSRRRAVTNASAAAAAAVAHAYTASAVQSGVEQAAVLSQMRTLRQEVHLLTETLRERLTRDMAQFVSDVQRSMAHMWREMRELQQRVEQLARNGGGGSGAEEPGSKHAMLTAWHPTVRALRDSVAVLTQASEQQAQQTQEALERAAAAEQEARGAVRGVRRLEADMSARVDRLSKEVDRVIQQAGANQRRMSDLLEDNRALLAHAQQAQDAAAEQLQTVVLLAATLQQQLVEQQRVATANAHAPSRPSSRTERGRSASPSSARTPRGGEQTSMVTGRESGATGGPAAASLVPRLQVANWREFTPEDGLVARTMELQSWRRAAASGGWHPSPRPARPGSARAVRSPRPMVTRPASAKRQPQLVKGSGAPDTLVVAPPADCSPAPAAWRADAPGERAELSVIGHLGGATVRAPVRPSSARRREGQWRAGVHARGRVPLTGKVPVGMVVGSAAIAREETRA